MKVKIKDLKPNPYRDMDNYPIDENKVKSLIDSIERTGFWDNILARKVNGSIQIAYGHHRLEALKKVFIPTDMVDIPVKDLSDATMIKIMANENMEAWTALPRVIDETVRVTKLFLEEHPEEAKSHWGSTRPMEQVTMAVISSFLNWPDSRVKYSLERLHLIENNKIDREARREAMSKTTPITEIMKVVHKTG